MYDVFLHPDVEAAFRELDPAIRQRVDRLLNRLRTDPHQYPTAERYGLPDIHVVKVGRHGLAYRISETDRVVDILYHHPLR